MAAKKAKLDKTELGCAHRPMSADGPRHECFSCVKESMARILSSSGASGDELAAHERTLLGLDIPVTNTLTVIGEAPAGALTPFEKQAFIDAAAIAIYASGWPAKSVYQRAHQLWEFRKKDLER